MIEHVWRCPECTETWTSEPVDKHHYDGRDYNLPECGGEPIEVYIIPATICRSIDLAPAEEGVVRIRPLRGTVDHGDADA